MVGTGGGGDGEGGGVDSEGGGWVDGRSFGRLEGGRGGDGESALVVEVVGHLLPALSLLVLVEARVATNMRAHTARPARPGSMASPALARMVSVKVISTLLPHSWLQRLMATM